MCEGLVNWTNKFSIKQNAADGLVLLLKHSGHPELPDCACTLLQTPRTISELQKLVLMCMRRNGGIKMSAANVKAVSKKLMELKPFVPKMFA